MNIQIKKYSGSYIINSTGKFASEPERFNIVFGDITMVLITGLIALASLIWLNVNVIRNN